MSASLPPSIKFQPIVGGRPLPEGKVKFFQAGTTTPQAVFASDGVTLIGTEVALDADGTAEFRLGDGLLYKVLLEDAEGVPVPGWTQDKIKGTDQGAQIEALSARTDELEDRIDSANAAIKVEFEAADAAVTEMAIDRENLLTLAFQAADSALDARLDAVETGQASGVVAFDTQANLYANLNYADKSVAYVTNDPTPAKNGTYRKSGASGAGSWVQSSSDRVALVEAQTASTEVSWLGDGVRNYSYLKKLNASDSVLRRTDWQGAWNLSSATRRIINRYSEPLLANIGTKSAGITQGNLTDHGLSNGATFPATATTDYAYLTADQTLVTGTKYSGVVFIKMTDLGTPVVGSNDGTGDFALLIGSALVPKTVPTLTNLGGNLWALRFENVSVTIASQNWGLIRYNTNSGRGFTVTGFNLWASTVGYPYIKNPGATYLDVTDYSVAADGKVTTTVTPEAGAETHWVPTSFALQSALAADEARITALEGNRALLNPTTHEVRGSYVPYKQFTSADDEAELAGNAEYNANVLGIYETMTQGTVFDAITAGMWTTTTPSDILWKLFIRDDTASFNTSTVTPDDSGTISAAQFPVVNSLYTLNLNKTLYAAAGKVVFLVFRKANGTDVNIRRWNTGSRHAFKFASGAAWPTSLSASTAPYLQAGFQLTLGANPSNATSETLDIVLPPTIYSVAGKEANVYFDNLISRDASDFNWDVACSYGIQQQERWTSNLDASAATSTMTISAYKKGDESPIASVTAAYVQKAASAGTGLNRKVLVIGDSTTAAGTTTGELVNLFSADAMAITLLGTKGSGANKHEGISGWTVNKFYTDPTSPFYFGGAFNFSTYMSTNGFAAVDWVLINLGINDVFGQTSDAGVDSVAATMISQLEAMITNIHVFNANVRIGIAVTTPPIATQDGFGTNYGCGQTRWRFKRNILRLARKLIDAFQGREATASKVYIVPLLTCIDTLHNMDQVTVAVNSRNTATVTRLNNGVHPDPKGYYQCADAYYFFLKGNET